MRTRFRIIELFCILMLSSTRLAFATGAEEEGPGVATKTIRTLKPVGVYFGGGSEPWPSIVSINFAFNVVDQLRFTAGTGTLVFGSSQGIGIKYLLAPEKPVSPIIGLNVARTRIWDFLGDSFGLKPEPDEVIWNTNFNFGIDWQARNGFNLGAGLT